MSLGYFQSAAARLQQEHLAELPFVTRVPGIPSLPRGQRVELDVLGSDEVELTLEARLHQVLSMSAAEELEPELEEGEEETVQAQTIRVAGAQPEEQQVPEGERNAASDDPNRASGVAS